jgi:hypothetical protein
MSMRDVRRTATSNERLATRPRRPEREQISRWENEGGALGHTAGKRPRPLP